MSLLTLLIIILVIGLILSLPSWPHSSGWGYGPSGIVGLILLVLVLYLLLGHGGGTLRLR